MLPPEIVSCVPINTSDCDPTNKFVVSVKSETSAGIVGLFVMLAQSGAVAPISGPMSIELPLEIAI